MFTTYYDAAGTQSDPDASLLFMTGLLASADRWESFEPQWDAMLGEFAVPYLHMKELTAFPFRGPYKSWDEPKRARFLARAAGIMCDTGMEAFSTTFLMGTYRTVNRDFLLPPAYVLCGLLGLAQSTLWMREHWAHESLFHIIERGDEGQGPLRDAVNKGANPFLERTTFRPAYDEEVDKWFGPFQAVDYYAWEHRKLLGEHVTKGQPRPRKSYDALKCISDHDHGMLIDETELRRLCHILNVPRRDATTASA